MMKVWYRFLRSSSSCLVLSPLKNPLPLASMISNSFFSSDLSVYSSSFSFDGSCSSSPCLKTTFPWRLHPLCLLTLHPLWGSHLCLFTHYRWLPYIFFEPTLFFRTSESRISLPAGNLYWCDSWATQARHVQDSHNPSPNMLLLLHSLAQQMITFSQHETLRVIWDFFLSLALKLIV